mgnify:FL=1|tara:strand:- start:366 stop:608 length:243 start_codon:yes stop_codon:yes gene_type:complete
MSTAETLRLYCDPEQTPARSMAHQLDQLSKASAELVNSMRDLSPADLYQALHKFNRQVDYTCGEVAGAVIALEDLHKEQA